MFHLICVHEFGKYTKGQRITDPAEIESLQADRDHHFVRIASPVDEETAAPAETRDDPMSLLAG